LLTSELKEPKILFLKKDTVSKSKSLIAVWPCVYSYTVPIGVCTCIYTQKHTLLCS